MNNRLPMNSPELQSPLASYAKTWLVLLGLLIANIGLAHFRLGSWNLFITLAIAFTQAVLVLLGFMHLARGKNENLVAACAAFLWLGILIVGTLQDYLSRNWIPGLPFTR